MASAIHQCASHGDYLAYQFKRRWSGCQYCVEERKLPYPYQQHLNPSVSNYKYAQDDELADIPESHRYSRFANFHPGSPEAEKTLQFCRNYVSQFNLNWQTKSDLVFCGGTVSGKTHLALAIAHELHAQGRYVRYTTANKVRTTTTESAHLLAELTHAELLILDDVDAPTSPAKEECQLKQIITTRHQLNKPSLIITRLEITQLSQLLGHDLTDKLTSRGGTIIRFLSLFPNP